MNDRYLKIYLTDHAALAQSGEELAERCLKENRGTSYEHALEELVAEIQHDREVLREVLDALDIRPSVAKEAIAWLGEKVGRLKVNGTLTEYSALSRLLEFEALSVGVLGKRKMWQSLRLTSPAATHLQKFNLADLIERANSQRARLEALHAQAAAEAFDSRKPGA